MLSNNLKIWLLGAALSLLLAGCDSGGAGVAEGDPTVSGEVQFELLASDEGYINAPTSRAYEQSSHTEFESGDKIGLFIARDGEVFISNEPFTCNSQGDWIGDIEYKGGAFLDSNGEPKDGVEYFAYFPYDASLDTSSITQSSAAGASASDFFAKVVESWAISDDQGAEGYQQSDLMIAKGYFDDILLTTHSLYLGFVHQMSMLHLEFPNSDSSPADNISLTIDSKSVSGAQLNRLTQGDFAGCTNHYRYIVRPSESEQQIGIEYDFGGKQDITTSASALFAASCYVYYIVDSSALPAAEPTPIVTAEGYNCVGAFWRNEEKGERIVSITPTEADYGAWRAVVYNMDLAWLKRENIQLSGDMSDFDASQDAEQFVVNDGVQLISGFADYTMPIEFRVGLKATFTPTAQTPARYATILLTYCNNTKYQIIYLRQGEGEDYLFRKADTAGEGITERPQAQKWSPFNLTASAELWTAAGYADIADKAQFVEYPSQVGAMFQWGSSLNLPVAKRVWRWSGATSAWTSLTTNYSYWATLAATHSLTPDGYHRPTDGATDAAVPAIEWNESQTKQSLFATPEDGSNCQYGYIADGYYDRAGSEATDHNRAEAGVLFYNPRNFGSLFFPLASTLAPTTGLVDATLSRGYWSSTMQGLGNPWHLSLSSSTAPTMIYSLTHSTALPIRVVRDEKSSN